MTNSKTTKRALLSSVVALFICFSMLLGTTFAWFTDTVTSSGNKIQAGTLKIDLELLENGTYSSVRDMTAPIFNYDKWEPGYTEVKTLKIVNEGNLALKYQLNVVAANADCILANVIDVYMCFGENTATSAADLSDTSKWWKCGTLAEMMANPAGFTQGKLLPAGATYDGTLYGQDGVVIGDITATIALHMQETAGNEYQGLDLGNIDVTLLATQFTYESDSFDDQYDKDSQYPPVETIVDSGSTSGINWTLTDAGTLTVSPSSSITPDANSGKVFNPGQWREAVVYNSNGGAVAEGYNRPNATADEGGYFVDRNAVTSLVIEEGVTSIGSFAAQFPNLTGEVVIPASVTYIGQEAFQHCNITKLTFAAGGTEELCIAPGAFKSLDIEEVVLPADRPAVHVHCWAFNDCTSLKHITFPANITTFSQWTHVDYIGNMNYVQSGDSQILARCTALESITFGSQAVHDMFFAAPYNTNNINAIGNVDIIINN